MSQTTSLFIVDAFTDQPFQGNPAAVCPLTVPADDAWMQRVASEMNLSETAFTVPQAGGVFGLRWFTPTVEVDLCGHATLATAHLLWEQRLAPPEQALRFETRSGLLTCTRRQNRIELDFPAEPPVAIPASRELSAALRAEPLSLGRNRFDLIAEFPDEAAVRAVTPDFGLLKGVPARGVIVTARSQNSTFDFVSRFFAPAVGVNEDPVCGSAHCCLGPFWGARLGKTELLGHQVSARGGVVGMRLMEQRVILSGTAVTVVRGTLASQ